GVLQLGFGEVVASVEGVDRLVAQGIDHGEQPVVAAVGHRGHVGERVGYGERVAAAVERIAPGVVPAVHFARYVVAGVIRIALYVRQWVSDGGELAVGIGVAGYVTVGIGYVGVAGPVRITRLVACRVTGGGEAVAGVGVGPGIAPPIRIGRDVVAAVSELLV